ncbi:hypothetical protein GV792_04910 [Nocardia cyriacigeorgica]|uniref:hypothetical protein n=1 Tax=Nocardia cyriacigeorgica TaxID=135487 RepID=UPI0013BC57AE|nr:hypothetical protein [Nocardia cyriacigeorgica]NEW49384.1 hypothetical protein [Nocardia cyriacigeorgica]
MSSYITTWLDGSPQATFLAHVGTIAIEVRTEDTHSALVSWQFDPKQAEVLRDQLTAAIELAQLAAASSAPVAELSKSEREPLGGAR